MFALKYDFYHYLCPHIERKMKRLLDIAIIILLGLLQAPA
jgi:hypothetical protein